jgi:hypothetical protein
MKHTGGEWQAVKGNSQMTWPDKTTICRINYNQYRQSHYYVISDAKTHGNEKATATLIAAAPAMLDALINSRNLLLKAGLNCDNTDVFSEINAAIKKATIQS